MTLLMTVPMLHVSDMTAALGFYCDRLGFAKISQYQPGQGENPVYVVLRRDVTGLHLSSFSGDGTPGAVAVIFVDDVDALYREFRGKGVDVGLEPVDQSWGNREMYISDPDGNQLRYTQPGAS